MFYSKIGFNVELWFGTSVPKAEDNSVLQSLVLSFTTLNVAC